MFFHRNLPDFWLKKSLFYKLGKHMRVNGIFGYGGSLSIHHSLQNNSYSQPSHWYFNVLPLWYKITTLEVWKSLNNYNNIPGSSQASQKELRTREASSAQWGGIGDFEHLHRRWQGRGGTLFCWFVSPPPISDLTLKIPCSS
jgi:hypothetical protein